MHESVAVRDFSIDRTWDGEPVPGDEIAHLRVARHGAGLEVEIDAPWHGDPPPPALPGPTDRLWEFEVVEFFVAGAAAPREPVAYTEVELSPFGHHLVLRFLGERNPTDRALQLAFHTERGAGRWRGRAIVPARYLPPEPWTANAFAIHGVGGGRRFLAAHPLPGERPDFHRPREFPPLALGR